jgi:predicted metal-dependent phosphoesterase TrpH
VLIDLHTHTAEYSTCSSLTVAEIVAGSRAAGFDAICLSEHDKIWPAQRIAELSRALNFPIFRAMEVTTSEGHVLVFGLDEYQGAMFSLRRLREITTARYAAMIKSHPMRDSGAAAIGRALPDYLRQFDALEVLSGGESKQSNGAALMLAQSHSIPASAGGDVHAPSEIGRFATRFERHIVDEQMLAAEIIAGRIAPFEAARR